MTTYRLHIKESAKNFRVLKVIKDGLSCFISPEIYRATFVWAIILSFIGIISFSQIPLSAIFIEKKITSINFYMALPSILASTLIPLLVTPTILKYSLFGRSPRLLEVHKESFYYIITVLMLIVLFYLAAMSFVLTVALLSFISPWLSVPLVIAAVIILIWYLFPIVTVHLALVACGSTRPSDFKLAKDITKPIRGRFLLSYFLMSLTLVVLSMVVFLILGGIGFAAFSALDLKIDTAPQRIVYWIKGSEGVAFILGYISLFFLSMLYFVMNLGIQLYSVASIIKQRTDIIDDESSNSEQPLDNKEEKHQSTLKDKVKKFIEDHKIKKDDPSFDL